MEKTHIKLTQPPWGASHTSKHHTKAIRKLQGGVKIVKAHKSMKIALKVITTSNT